MLKRMEAKLCHIPKPVRPPLPFKNHLHQYCAGFKEITECLSNHINGVLLDVGFIGTKYSIQIGGSIVPMTKPTVPEVDLAITTVVYLFFTSIG